MYAIGGARACALICLLVVGGAADLRADEIPEDETEILQTQFSFGSQEPDPFEQYGIKQIKPGTSTSTARKAAAADVPVDRLNPTQRAKVQQVLKSVSLYRCLPTLQFEVDPAVYTFFMQNPDVAVSTWRAMEISRFQLNETQPGIYHGDAGDGSVGDIEVLYRNPEEVLLFCDGQFKSPAMARPITARAVMWFQAAHMRQPDGRVICTHRGEVFVEFPQHMVDAMARVISPVSHTICDRNFKQITLFVSMMSRLMSRQPSWVEQLAANMDGIPAARKQQMLDLAEAGYREAADRMRQQDLPTTPLPVEDVLQPFRAAARISADGKSMSSVAGVRSANVSGGSNGGAPPATLPASSSANGTMESRIPAGNGSGTVPGTIRVAAGPEPVEASSSSSTTGMSGRSSSTAPPPTTRTQRIRINP